MMTLNLSRFKYEYCNHCKNNVLCRNPISGKDISSQCVGTKLGHSPSAFVPETDVDAKYAQLLEDHVDMLSHLGFNIVM